MIRQIVLAVAIVFLAVTSLISAPAPANAAGWFNQSQATQSLEQLVQVDQYAQEDQYTQTEQSYPEQKGASTYANNQSNQPGSQNGASAQNAQ